MPIPIPPASAPDPLPGPQSVPFMVVDDDPLTAQLIANTVRPLGRVGLVQDFPSAIFSIDRSRPRVVFLDVDLPGKTGIEINRQIRSNPELDGVYVVLITSHDSASVQKMIDDAHADEVLQKPLDPEAVLRLAQRMLATAREA